MAQALDRLIRRLETITSLSEDDKNAILALPANGLMLTSSAREIDPRNVVFSSKVFCAATKFFPTATGRSWPSMCPATSPIS